MKRKSRRGQKLRKKIFTISSVPKATDGIFIIPEHCYFPGNTENIKRLWIVTDPNFRVKDTPVHHKNCFLEDRLHDWDLHYVPQFRENLGIRYYGNARGSNNVRFLVEFEYE